MFLRKFTSDNTW